MLNVCRLYAFQNRIFPKKKKKHCCLFVSVFRSLWPSWLLVGICFVSDILRQGKLLLLSLALSLCICAPVCILFLSFLAFFFSLSFSFSLSLSVFFFFFLTHLISDPYSLIDRGVNRIETEFPFSSL